MKGRFYLAIGLCFLLFTTFWSCQQKASSTQETKPAGAISGVVKQSAPTITTEASISPDSQFVLRVCDKRLQEKLSSIETTDSTYVKDNCYRLKRNDYDMYLSCYHIESRQEWIVDFNKDGHRDLLIRFDDEGAGGGGNMYTYDYELLLLKENTLADRILISGGAKMSFTHLKIKQVRNNRVYASTEFNPFALQFSDPVLEEVKEMELEFYMDSSGHFTSRHYEPCAMYAMDKRIFKSDIPNVKREVVFNSNYYPTQNEAFSPIRSEWISASLSGCDNMELHFSFRFPFEAGWYKADANLFYLAKEKLEFLIQKTRFKTLLTDALAALQAQELHFSQEEPILFGKGWTMKVGLDGTPTEKHTTIYFLIEEPS